MLHQIGLRLRGQISHFSGELCAGMGKVMHRFVGEMIYGIQARASVRLSEIARALDEPTSVKKRIDRLSRNLGKEDICDRIGDAVLQKGSRHIDQDTLLIVDPTDVTKKYAKKMEYLAKVRDGSEKVIGLGYWVDTIVGARTDSEEIVPLVHQLYSQDAPDFVSENNQLLNSMQKVHQACQGKGIFVIDRGGDRGKIYKKVLKIQDFRFIIRQRGDRHILYKEELRETLELANRCKTPYSATVIKVKDGKEKVYHISFGFLPVRLPELPEKKLFLVVAKGFGEKPLMLLTTEPLRRDREVVWKIVQSYITRWRVEETIRFIKQSYDFEDIRVLTYQRLRNLTALVLAASFFTAVYLGTKAKLEVLALHVLHAAGRIFGIPNFRYYALADGIREILSRVGKGILKPRKSPLSDPDQCLLFEV